MTPKQIAKASTEDLILAYKEGVPCKDCIARDILEALQGRVGLEKLCDIRRYAFFYALNGGSLDKFNQACDELISSLPKA